MLLKADVSDLKSKFAEAEKETKKLSEGLDTLSKTNNKTGESLLNTVNSFGRFIAASSAALFVVSGFKHALDFGVDLNRTSRILGVNADELNAWGNAVELAGGDAKQFQSTLQSLAKNFGASPSVALRALPLYGDLFSKLSPARAQQVGKQLGIDEGTILLLQQGRREVEDIIKRQKELGVVTAQDAELYGKFKVSLTETSQATQRFFNQLAIIALPTLIQFEKASAAAFNYFTKHPDFIAGAFKAIEVGVVAMAGAFVYANPLIAAFAASLAAIATAYEDIQAFLKGGKNSLLGDILGVGKGGYPEFKTQRQKESEVFDKLSYSQRFLYTFIPGYHLSDLVKDGSKTSSLVINNPVINTQAQDGEGLLADLNKYANGQFNAQAAQATNYFTNGVAM